MKVSSLARRLVPVSACAVLVVTSLAVTAEAAQNTCFGKVPTILGTDRDDLIDGTAGSDVIMGLGGDDEINGKAGNDFICGGRGHDNLVGDDGHDHLDGGPSRTGDYLKGNSPARTFCAPVAGSTTTARACTGRPMS